MSADPNPGEEYTGAAHRLAVAVDVYWEDLQPSARPTKRLTAIATLLPYIDRFRDAASALERSIKAES